MNWLAFVQIERDDPNPTQKVMQNLLSHLPGEATGLYLGGLDAVGKDASAYTYILIALFCLGVLLLVRFLAKASRSVTIASVIAFVIWVYALGTGPFQALEIDAGQGVGTFLVIAYSTVVTILASYGKIK